MSLLAPFYLLGALAIGLPILFHLIRRRPTGAIQFSSHMFLQPTPPRLTRRSRLENWPLLLMRALALILMAAAFARPFLRSTQTSSTEKEGRRIVLVLDKSASMRRDGVWESAVEDATKVVDELTAEDQLAIVAFDDEPNVLFSFEQSTELDNLQRKRAARAAIGATSPSWKKTEMGQAISFAADLAAQHEMEEDKTELRMDSDSNTRNQQHANATVVLVSDMQQGAEIESLQQYVWPKSLTLETHRIDAQQTTNVAAQVLSESRFTEPSDRLRVRVSNAPDSQSSQFTLRYAGSADESSESELPVQVPPGESRVVRMPLPSPSVTSLVVDSDDHRFDNQWHLVSNEPKSVSLLYVGTESGDATATQESQDSVARNSLLYYLQRVPISNKRVDVTVNQVAPDKLVAAPSPSSTPLIVIAEPVSQFVAKQLREYVKQGGRVLFVLSNADARELQTTITTVSGSPADKFVVAEADIDDYSMLTDIQFTHPIFQSMADPKFNDFTKVRFWSHRRIQNVPDTWSVLANFDDGNPALLEHQQDTGRIWVLAAGWQPAESQLALSTKFLPLVYSFFGRLSNSTDTQSSIFVGSAPPFAISATAIIRDPDGNTFAFNENTDTQSIDQPGIYSYEDGENVKRFAVNLATSESNTAPLERTAFERFGIKLGVAAAALPSEATKRQLRDIELEKQQKIWQWLLAAALALLAVETLWGGLISRRSTMVSPSRVREGRTQ